MSSENIIPLRLSTTQATYLENAAAFLSNASGKEISRQSVILRILEKGWPVLIEEIAGQRAAGNSQRTRMAKQEGPCPSPLRKTSFG